MQTGEHVIMIESLDIKNIVVVLNKTDLFRGDVEKEVKNIRSFFETTMFGANIPVFAVSAKEKKGFEELKMGILEIIKNLDLTRDIEGNIIFPIDHYFSIKGRGAVITGTLLKGQLKLNQKLEVLPVITSGRVKSIQMFHQDVDSAKAGDRIGINIKGLDVKKIYRGCIATDNKDIFDYCDLLEVKVRNNNLFKPETHFGTQVHVTIGMFTTVGNLFPYYELDGKKIQTSASSKDHGFNAFLWLTEKILISKEKTIMLISRLDLPPTTLRILGSAELTKIHQIPPTLHKYKLKTGRIQKPEHSQGIICTGLAQSFIGAKKMIGKKLESPFTKIIATFGTKGAVILGIEGSEIKVNKGDKVILKELRSFKLMPKRD